MNESKKAVVTVLGYDRKGIIAKVSAVLYECDANIVDISQTVLSGLFNMVLVADISSPDCAFDQLSATPCPPRGGAGAADPRAAQRDL